MLAETQKPQSGQAAASGYYHFNTSDILRQFKEAINAAGISVPDNIVSDGQLHRFSSSGKKGDKNGYYRLHSDGIPAGMFGCWKLGIQETWRADIGRDLTVEEIQSNKERIEEMQRARAAEESEKHAKAAQQAAKILEDAQEDNAFLYLAKKAILPHGAKVHNDQLIVPMNDIAGTLWNVERISQDGTQKRGLAGGKRTGLFYTIGSIDPSTPLCIAEGFATGASISEATGYPVACAFNAGNLLHVAQSLREKYPEIPLVICADDDHRTDGNPGLTKANEAAAAVGAWVAVPDFGDARPEGATDFNDMANHCGHESIRGIFSTLFDLGGDTGDTGDNINESLTNNDLEHDNLSPLPKNQAGTTGDKVAHFKLIEYQKGKRNGVYFIEPADEGTDKETWICSPLRVLAETRDGSQENWGLLIPV